MAKKKKPVTHRHRYLTKEDKLECSLCGREAPKVNILESSLKRSLSKKAMLEYYKITKEQAKDFFVYMMTRF